LKRLIGLTAIGGAVYVHKQRGGTWTLVSMRDTLQYLLSQAATKLGQMNRPVEATQRASYPPATPARPRMPDDNRPRPAGGDLSGKRDDSSRH
jgi:hypothetical protein